ncbi:uncharacterized protein SAPINGB_P003796 [Magnusiomyces paraingens]|uniref:2'-phosphotransferase n=1 Tax=Magnusiomyces paraingens TaxID=2606893 RepID=A0A5E8BTE3_9ASCO|nr:uncharacterized protein SAPINGB_P003796 [Saprochaete ingens]VVT53879.1 unnamed protein product [Saprochaete ingens]
MSATGDKDTRQKRPRRPADTPDVKLSKALSYVLRHGAAKERIPMRPDGYVRVSDLFKSSRFHAFTAADIARVARENSKQRFALARSSASGSDADPEPVALEATERLTDATRGEWFIRANQGHSLTGVEVEMRPLLRVEDFPVAHGASAPCAVHGTNATAWKKIKESGGLSRMARTHIHLAPGLAGDAHVTSGMRASATVYIYVNIAAALTAGLQFWESANGVLLSEGDENGRIPVSLFDRVVERRPDGTLAELPIMDVPE